MEVKDEVVSWFIRNIMAPRILDITHPGFIILNSIQKSKETYRRQFFISEDLFADIEKGFVEKYGEKGALSLYAAGKKFGYKYAAVSHFPSTSNSSAGELKDVSSLAIMFVGANWATKSQALEVDPKGKHFRLRMWDYAVCNKNGIGHILGSGGIAGIWAYMMESDEIEAVQTSCQGKGGKYCEFFAAPRQALRKAGLVFMESRAVRKEPEEEGYVQVNAVRPLNYSQISMNDLVDSGTFKFKDSRKAVFQGSDYLAIEASILGILETELAGNNGGERLLFDICHDFGKRTGSGTGWNKQFMADYLSATGFGDIVIIKERKYRLMANYYPWTRFDQKTNFVIFRGLASGLLSAITGEDIRFSKTKTELAGDSFSVTIGA